MIRNDIYTHYKGNDYQFKCIALPLNEVEDQSCLVPKGTARYYENDRDIPLYFHNGVWLIDSDLPHVIYQSEANYGTDKVWAREVDDFFGYKEKDGRYIKRFALKHFSVEGEENI
ncbi:DUF1653 domain-containing protein [Aeribacillus composti]|jgi:hypothetical protein|uniref:DUF1653 domain-containing protein n=2 Tax=Aeribacillus composti TaxID=1868734 RepID=A0ABY9WLV7_9BACI|nr:DUF1653 domain-containing protein [Aeribacillus composti]WNF34261.1 DUF1653 domain-containing protein [Aeribacillus composti]